MTIFWLKIFILVFIAALIYYILILTQALIEATRAFSEQKKKEQGEDSPSQIHVFFAPIILFLLVIWKYQYSLNVFIPIVAVFYWIMVIGLIIVLMIILIFFYKRYTKDKANAIKMQDFKKTSRDSIFITLIWYAYITENIQYAPEKLTAIVFLCYFLQKIYVRIIKQLDFIDESDNQQEQTRFNNKILLFFPIWCLIFFFANKQIEFFITLLYLSFFYSYYQTILPVEEKWPLIVVPIGSPERAELYWEAFNSIAEPPIEIHVSKTVYTQEMNEYKRHLMFSMGIDSDEAFDQYNPGHALLLHLGDDTKDWEKFDDELFKFEMKIKVAEFRNYMRYMHRKKCPIHEYYFWWLMTEVPFYFSIRAFFDMVWDNLWNILRLILLCYVSIFPLLCFLKYLHINALNVDELMMHYHICIIYAYIVTWYIGITDLTRPYSWLIFFYRKEAYRMYDRLHPYAIYGPTIDGPRNWQYWFFILFNYFPVRALILQKELFAEEIRITEGIIQLTIDDVDDAYDSDDVTEEPMIWNPLVWYRLRNSTPEQREAIKKAVLKDQAEQKKAEEKKETFKQLAQPKWWTHYSI